MPDSHFDTHSADPHAAVAEHAEAGHHEPFNFKTALMHHNMPYPAWELFHGKPWITFDLGTYSAINYSGLSHDASFAGADGAKYSEWAKQVVETGDFRYPGGLQADQVAKAMVVAEHQSGIVFPRALSWMNQQIFFGSIALIILFLVIGIIFRRKATQLKPAGRVQHAIEAIICSLRDDIVKPSFHDAASSWTPFFCSMFFIILAVNLFGLLPGTGTMSGNIGVTAGFAVISFFCMLFFGLKEQGPKYWINLVPIHFSLAMSPIWLLLFVLEIMGLIIRPFALAVRLFANMFAGHTVLLVLLSLGYLIIAQSADSAGMAYGFGGIGFLLAVAFHAMEILVAFVQAYVFTMLSAMFIGMSIHPEH
jgi:F-type H+-transporting ATPase subunit a